MRSEKSKLFLMKDIRKTLIERESDIGEKMLDVFAVLPTQRRPDERIKACVIGVPI
jgi:hypothetical protein